MNIYEAKAHLNHWLKTCDEKTIHSWTNPQILKFDAKNREILYSEDCQDCGAIRKRHLVIVNTKYYYREEDLRPPFNFASTLCHKKSEQVNNQSSKTTTRIKKQEQGIKRNMRIEEIRCWSCKHLKFYNLYDYYLCPVVEHFPMYMPRSFKEKCPLYKKSEESQKKREKQKEKRKREEQIAKSYDIITEMETWLNSGSKVERRYRNRWSIERKRRDYAIYRLYRFYDQTISSIASRSKLSEHKINTIIGRVFKNICIKDRTSIFRPVFTNKTDFFKIGGASLKSIRCPECWGEKIEKISSDSKLVCMDCGFVGEQKAFIEN